jgi:hypothetical protein
MTTQSAPPPPTPPGPGADDVVATLDQIAALYEGLADRS